MTRFAVYWLPEGPLARLGASWLGWDAARGREVAHPDLPGLPAPAEEITRAPRRYGLHATLKPPFRLQAGGEEELAEGIGDLAARLPPAEAGPPRLGRLGRFLALVPGEPTAPLAALAARVVKELDGFRAPPDAAELARRRATGLTPREDALLRRWGYPYVMEAFRFHVTLSGPLDPDALAATQAALGPVLAPLLPGRLRVDAIGLLREDASGRFHLRRRFALTGTPPG